MVGWLGALVTYLREGTEGGGFWCGSVDQEKVMGGVEKSSAPPENSTLLFSLSAPLLPLLSLLLTNHKHKPQPTPAQTQHHHAASLRCSLPIIELQEHAVLIHSNNRSVPR